MRATRFGSLSWKRKAALLFRGIPENPQMLPPRSITVRHGVEKLLASLPPPTVGYRATRFDRFVEAP